MSSYRAFTFDEIKSHNKPDDAWVVIDGGVYDVTQLLKEHPGGIKPLLANAGKDATTVFQQFHGQQTAAQLAKRYLIGYALPSSKL